MANVNSLRKLSDNNEDAKRANAYRINPKIIQVQQGWNARGAGMDHETYWSQEHVKAHISGFAKSYRDGTFVPPIVVQVIDGVPYVRDGEHRIRGAWEAIENGVPLQLIDVVESAGDELQQTYTMAKSNDSLAWNAVERAVLYARLKAYGASVEQIAENTGKSVQHVYQQLKICDMPLELKRMIAMSEVSASVAISTFDEHGSGAIEMLRGVQTAPGSRVKPQNLKPKSAPVKFTKPLVELARSWKPEADTTGDKMSYVIRLTPEEYEAFIIHQEKLKEFE